MRATLAEKEVNTLKEQLSNASVNPVQLSTSDKKMATSPTPNENADINRSAIDLELSAKDREPLFDSAVHPIFAVKDLG
ncbi:hypothetical protein M8J75_005965 [Diaphorina citri]|nr:hypothetical protein M8J75_005965 [Diaphorina citri]